MADFLSVVWSRLWRMTLLTLSTVGVEAIVAALVIAGGYGLTLLCGGRTSTTPLPCRNVAKGPFSRCRLHSGITSSDLWGLLLMGLGAFWFVWWYRHGMASLTV